MNLRTLQNTFAVLAAGASFALPLSASAQAATKAAPAPAVIAPAPAAPTPMTAPLPPVTPEIRAAVKDLLDAMNMRENLTKNFQGMTQSIAPQMAQAIGRQIDQNPTLTPEQKAKVLEGMKQPFDNAMREVQGMVTSPKVVDDTMAKMVPVYAKYFTTAEIKQLTAFYRSPVGAKTLAAMPQAIAESLQATFADLQPRINGLMEKTLKTQVDTVTATTATPTKK